MSASIRREDPGFPRLLREIPDPPASLNLSGTLAPDAPAVAIVGSRRPTLYGKRTARRLAFECAQAGIVVVSGLARGIDTEVHEGALEAGGLTWAVLGSGLGKIYPHENRGLAARIVAGGGAVISEYEPDEGPRGRNFPFRNRIISGLASGTVVVEGGLKSGSLITARLAGEQGREVFAVPGQADSPMSEGPNFLLQNGARLTRGLADILAELPDLSTMTTSGGDPRTKGRGFSGVLGAVYEEAGMTPDHEKILELLGSASVSLEELLSETGFGLNRTVQILSDMERRGFVKPLPGQQYARI